jgi:hypothetical protein
VGKVVNGSNAYSWNVTVGALVGLSSPAILSVVQGDVIIGTSTSFSAFSAFGTPDPFTFWAINLNRSRGAVGQILWCRNYTAPDGNLTLAYMGAPSSGSTNVQVDSVNRVFFVTNKETMQWWGYDLDSGNLLWGPVGDFRAFQYYGTVSNPPAPGYVYKGVFYVAGYGGVLNAIESRTGNVLWTYGNGGVGNSTNSGLDTPWGNYPLFISAFADGKIYCFSGEHSPNSPLYKDEKVRCINATTGEEIWIINGWPGIGSFGQTAGPIADGYYVYLNIYDMQIYCIGKGPSTTTIEAPLAGLSKGQSLVIQGMVTDQSSGAKEKVASGEFSVVPAMSDESMSKWMEYIYMQKPMPTNATGVTVKLTAVDANGNTVNIGTATTETSGLYSYVWIPENTGKYVITATFEGTESYWGSSAVTAISVDAAAVAPTAAPTPTLAPTATPTATPTTAPTASPSPAPSPPGYGLGTEYYIAIAAVVIIIAIAAVAVILRRRK